MCSGLHGDETPRYLRKCLLHRFRCHRHFLLQNDCARFIQNAVARPAISQIHTDRQLLLLQNFVSQCLHSANLLHSRSPFCALSASIIGSVSHPAGDRPSHLICLCAPPTNTACTPTKPRFGFSRTSSTRLASSTTPPLRNGAMLGKFAARASTTTTRPSS